MTAGGTVDLGLSPCGDAWSALDDAMIAQGRAKRTMAANQLLSRSQRNTPVMVGGNDPKTHLAAGRPLC